MSSNDNALNNKVSTHIQTQLPEFIQADHPLFSQFVKFYYQFLESAEITFSEVNNYLVQETQSVSFVLDENNDNIVLEDSEAKFTVGETITGLTSGATAKILVDDVDNNKRLFITSQTRFILGETVNGSVSNSSGTVQTYKPNPVSSIQQLLNYTNIDSTLYQFLDNFRDAFLEGIVDNLDAGVDKRKLVKNIRDLYLSKGTKKGHELFFRLLLNETPTVQFPSDNVLRVSDGQWTIRKIIRVKVINGVASELIGQTLVGQTSQATGIVASTISFREAEEDIVEIELDEATLTGSFEGGEILKGTSTVTDTDVSMSLYGIVTGSTVTNGGSYYTADQLVNITSEGSNTVTARIGTVERGVVDGFIIDNAGTGYVVGDDVTFNNANTDGTGVVAKVSVVGGGIAPETGSLAQYGMTANEHITLEETSQSFYLDSYEGTKIVLEDGTFANAFLGNGHVNTSSGFKAEGSEITDIRLLARGVGYSRLPIVTGVTSLLGSNAKIVAISNSGIGKVGSFKIINQGFNYESGKILIDATDGSGGDSGDSIVLEPGTTGGSLEKFFLKTDAGTYTPSLIPFRHAVVQDITGNFTATPIPLTSHTGTITAIDNDRQLISMNTTADLKVGDTIQTGTASAIIANIDTAVGLANVGQVADTEGEFFGSDGKISEDVMRVQDSNFYQDYSYVIRVGQSINEWRDAIKSTVHPAGWGVFGEVEVKGLASARITAQTLDSFTPELASLFRTFFSAIFGRRLGTIDDGTSLKASPAVGSDNLTSFPNTNRDVTLTRNNKVIVGVARTTAKNHGPTLDLLPKYAFAISPRSSDNNLPNYPTINRTAAADRTNDEYFTIGQFADIRIDQVSDSNGVIPLAAFETKINVPPPGQIDIDRSGRINAFDNTFITFDNTFQKFDETVQNVRMSSTTVKFDSSSVKFDGSGGSSVPRDIVGKYNVDFSDTDITFDSGINKFDAQSSASSGSNIPRFDDEFVTFDNSGLKFDNTSIPERFSSNTFKFDSTSKTFDIGDLPT